jgi:hypothetical protein
MAYIAMLLLILSRLVVHSSMLAGYAEANFFQSSTL